MTRPRQEKPDFAAVFRKIAELESSRGYADRAVSGGLDKFRQQWQAEMASRASGGEYASFLLGRQYADMPRAERESWVSGWLRLLDSDPAKVPEDARSSPPSKIESGLAEESWPEADAPAPPGPGQRIAPPANSAPASFRLPPPGQTVDASVTSIKGVSGKTADRLARLGVSTVRDLLYLFPRRHEDFSAVVQVADVVPDQDCTLVVNVLESRVVRQGPKGRRQDTEAILCDETGTVRAIWFGQRYLARMLQTGARVAISGRAKAFRGQISFESPALEPADSDQPGVHTGRLVPVYPLTEGIAARAMRGFTWDALHNWLGGVEETLPDSMAVSDAVAGRMPLREAIYQAHYPDSQDAWQAARSRLAFDELLTLQLAVLTRRHEAQAEVSGVSVSPAAGVVENFLESLPFELTAAQARCISEIARDMQRGAPPMNRLLQGEVGSGKTVVALAALLSTVAAGFQGALMAPTEVLAEQHFRSASRLLEGLRRPVEGDNLFSVHLEGLGRPVSVGLLTGSVRASVKRTLTAMAADGTLDLIIGTQALIQEGVAIPSLALAVADEQHRFGVMQRSALQQRGGENPHTLLMSATPIPRTLYLTLYGDLDISTLDELPAGRQKVRTRLVTQENRARAYGFVREQVQEGRQAFVVCPLIDESSTLEVRAATDEYERLSGEVFPDLRVGLLHGRMSSRDKDRVLRSFSDGQLDVLVTTAVVEVGIDMPNATIMLIEGAERFGLAQLHQFRGRVGRGEHRSYCFLLSSEALTHSARERLDAMERTHDGFRLAEIDLQLRGPGDFFGTRQSGLPALKMAQVLDRELLESARELATRISDADPELTAPEHSALAAQVARFIDHAADVSD